MNNELTFMVKDVTQGFLTVAIEQAQMGAKKSVLQAQS
jgi:hypothetical protein